MAKANLIDIERLRQLVFYEPTFGSFTWNLREPSHFDVTGHKSPASAAKEWNERYAGEEAFVTKNNSGYLEGRIDGHTYLAHRVAWACYYGTWPKGQIDHINGVTTDNSIANLRNADPTINARNASLRKDNKSGAPGVSWCEATGVWRVQIGGTNNREHIGSFKSFEEAVIARRQAEKRLGYHPNHGRQKESRGG